MGKYTTEIGIRRRRGRIVFWGTVVLLSLATLVVLVMLFLLRSPWFRVRSVVIEGITYIPEDKVLTVLRSRVLDEDSKWDHLLGMRNLLTWPKALSKEGMVLLPQASAVVLEKDYMHGGVRVKVTEREHQGIWCFAPDELRCFWFDADGIISRAPATEGNLLLVVHDYTRKNIPEDGSLVAPELLPNLFSIFEALKRIDLPVKEIRLEDSALQEIRVATFDGPDLLFSLRFPAVNTPVAFEALKQKTSLKNLEYIDLRVENRVYYK